MIAKLEGARFGPATVVVAPERVADLVVATADDDARWDTHAPPSFASVGLFAIAPDLLADPRIGAHGRAIVHAEQRYGWTGAIPVGSTMRVEGTVERVRLRGATAFVDLAATMEAGDARITSFSRFLMAADAVAADVVPEPEPDAEARGPIIGPHPWDGRGESRFARSASRADLVRYAAASRDLNPIHWDHDRAVAAGFPGVVCHGLLQVAWMLQGAAAARPGPEPVAEIRVRFRAPLRPARHAEVRVTEIRAGGGGEGSAVDCGVVDLDAGVETVSGSLVLGPSTEVTA